MNEATTVQKFEIPSWNVDRLRTEFRKFTKKAAQLDCVPPRLIELETRQEIDPAYRQDVEEGIIRRDQAPKITIHVFTIEGSGPQLAGWKFLGTLDHNSLPGSVIVNAVPGETVPQQFYHNDAVCDHCGKVRRRTETFIVEHETGDQKQVGRQCIRDFLGHDPKAVLRYLSSIRRFVASLEEDEGWKGGCSGRSDWTFNSFEVLKMTNAVIRTFGWVSRTQAKEDLMGTAQATADLVLYLQLPPRDSYDRKEWDKLRDQIEWNDEKDEKDATGALEWLEKQNPESEYIHNLQTIARSEGVPSKMFGYWCSLMAAYQREQEKLIRAQRTQRVSEWVGKVKDKVELVVKVEAIRYIESRYGTTRIHKMLDTEGRSFTWFASSRSGMEQEHTYRIKGTIKKHDEYNGWKQTILTRVTALEEIESATSDSQEAA